MISKTYLKDGIPTINPQDIWKFFLMNVTKKTPLIFVCRSGARSARASQLTIELGFGIVFNMEGGMIKWNELGLPVKR